MGGTRIIPNYVYAIGHNENFIIAKQHPLTKETGWIIDKNTTNYYIIDIEKNKNMYTDEGIYGPMTKAGFDSLRHQLKITNLTFSMTYPEMP